MPKLCSLNYGLEYDPMTGVNDKKRVGDILNEKYQSKQAYCEWSATNELNKPYHDKEWGRPVHDDRVMFEHITLECLQCGLSWDLMLRKREVFRECFEGFDYDKVAAYSESDVNRILNTDGMIRSTKKIIAVINNAACFRQIREEYGSFCNYLWNYTGGKTVLYTNGPFSNYKTVSEVNKMIMDSFDATECFKTIMVKGEVTNYKGKPDDKGNRYFSIKDDKCLLSCILWKSKADQILKSEIKVGQKVALTGRFKYYDEKGTGSLHVNQIADMGTGEANLRYMELKAKLEEEGLFAIEHKKAIPKFPEKVGIVTSKEGQARKDIEKEALKRNPYIQLILYHANVQGKNAVKTIKEGIEKLDTMGLDTIIVGRGGGSDEELIAYNDESVARAVFNAQTPIITAVGHEGNWALVDWVSDKRVATPLEAAEEAIPDVMTVIKQIRQLEKNISDNMHRALENRKHRLETQTAKLKGNDPVRKLKERKDRLENLSEGLTQKIHMIFEKKKNRFNVLLAQLNGLSPTAKLVKGFGYISIDDKPVTSISNVHINDELDIRIHDGHIVTTVTGTVGE